LTEEWDTCIQEISPSKEFDHEEAKVKPNQNLFEDSRYDEYEDYTK